MIEIKGLEKKSLLELRAEDYQQCKWSAEEVKKKENSNKQQ